MSLLLTVIASTLLTGLAMPLDAMIACFDKVGNEWLEQEFDLLAIGRPLIANPDYVTKVKMGEALIEFSDEMLSQLI